MRVLVQGTVVATMLGVSGCSEEPTGLGEAHRFCEYVDPLSGGLVRIGEGLLAGEWTGCNECYCELDDEAPVGLELTQGCTKALCEGPSPFAGSDFPRCRSAADCGRQPGEMSSEGVCIFNAGCEEPFGFCVRVQSVCLGSVSEADPGFCGCDGVTHTGACPTVPYRHAGPCSD